MFIGTTETGGFFVRVVFIEAQYEGEVELCQDTLDYIKKYKKVALYAAIQFCNNLDKVKEQLEELGIEVITSQPKRTGCSGQLLGCDSAKDSLNLNEEVDAFLYIGDGKFHPQALAYGQDKDVICDDPIGKKFCLITKEELSANLKRAKGALVKFHSSSSVGVIVTLKPGQEFYKASLALEKKYPDKKFYYFIDNNISFNQLENFPFIDVWINTACPRIGFDDQEMFRKGVVNLREVVSQTKSL